MHIMQRRVSEYDIYALNAPGIETFHSVNIFLCLLTVLCSRSPSPRMDKTNASNSAEAAHSVNKLQAQTLP
jgi:hypothetical protein